jgi:CRP-like cAMP-binding protein
MKPEELEREFRAGESIVDSGSSVRELYVVRSGSVLVQPQDGSPSKLLGPGEMFGELNAILGQPCPYTARADSDSSVLALDVLSLNRLCAQSPDFSTRLIRHLALELSGTQSDVSVSRSEEALRPGMTKLIPVIFERRTSIDAPCPITGLLRELAEDAGLSTLEAYYCVQSLLERRYLQLVDDQLSLLEPEALKDLVA